MRSHRASEREHVRHVFSDILGYDRLKYLELSDYYDPHDQRHRETTP
jgi:hypothetical protein